MIGDAMKLRQSTLPQLPATIQTPRYDRSKVSKSIVHIGVGGFFRAHQAVYLDDLLQQPGNEDWGLCGVGLLAQDAGIGDVLRNQDFLYTVIERSALGDRARVIGSLLDFLHAPSDPEAVLEKMAGADCRIVALTITEGGYYINQGTGGFDDSHPDVLHDLTHPHAPRCTFGYLAEALERRRQRGLMPFTVLSCDNLQSNGDIAKKTLLEFARRRDPALSDWIAAHGAFPNSMVDRITPATTDRHRALTAASFGIEDGWPVITEPFRQWVLEDRFPGGRPAWEKVGVQMTDDVLPYEKMKLRLLNASHQAICYIGLLLGYRYVDEAMGDARIRMLMQTMMDEEVTPLLDPVPGVDLVAYKAGLIERFSNPEIRDELARIACESSARMPKFVLPSILEQLQRRGPLKLLAFTVACWFRFLAGHDDQGRPLQLVDPLAARLREYALAGGSKPQLLLAMHELFGDLLPAAPAFVDALEQALSDLYKHGAQEALRLALTAAD
jgi:mannitol 2-dehydrogenase